MKHTLIGIIALLFAGLVAQTFLRMRDVEKLNREIESLEYANDTLMVYRNMVLDFYHWDNED